MRFRAFALVCAMSAITPSLRAQAGDTTVARQVAPGVAYRQFSDPRGPWTMYLVRVDLKQRGIALRAARAHDALEGRERVSDMARRVSTTGARVVAAVNADFFNLKTGENENNQVIDGEWWKGLKVTDSPYDTWDNTHAQLAVGANGRPAIDRFLLDARAWAHGTMTPVITLNSDPAGKPEGTALYTSRFGARTPADTGRTTGRGAPRRGGTSRRHAALRAPRSGLQRGGHRDPGGWRGAVSVRRGATAGGGEGDGRG